MSKKTEEKTKEDMKKLIELLLHDEEACMFFIGKGISTRIIIKAGDILRKSLNILNIYGS